MYEKLLRDLRALKGKTLICGHSLADADAVASSIALSKLVPRSVVAMPDRAAGHARQIMSDLGVELPLLSPGELAGYDNLVLSDVSTLSLLGALKDEFSAFASSKEKKVIVVDHHLHSHRVPNAKHHIFSGRSSCSEVVLELFRRSKKKLDTNTALLLAVGILNDTAFVRSADWRTFVDLGELLERLSRSGWSYKRLLAVALPKPDIGQKIAILRGVASAKIFELKAKPPLEGNFLVALAFADTMELPCAGALVSAGADYAFVGSLREGKISGVRSETLEGAKVGKIMEAVGAALGGSGGGHEVVGGANGSPNRVEEGLRVCLRELESFYKVNARRL